MIKQEKITWEQGILQAADILEKKGCVGSDYGKKAVENVKEYGDYIIISKGIALAHAGKERGTCLQRWIKSCNVPRRNRIYGRKYRIFGILLCSCGRKRLSEVIPGNYCVRQNTKKDERYLTAEKMLFLFIPFIGILNENVFFIKDRQERVFDMKINIKEFTGKCSCGRNHQLVVDDVILEEGALKNFQKS